MGFKTAGFPKFGFNPLGFKQSIGGFISLVKSAGGVLYLDARKADGSAPLTGNDSPFKDLTTESNDGTLTNFAGSGTSGWNEVTNYNVNEVENYDFSDGTNSWIPSNCTLSESNNVLTSIGNGGSSIPYALSSGIEFLSGDKIFSFIKMRVTNSDSTLIRSRMFSATPADLSVASPVQDQWYEVYGLRTATANDTQSQFVTHVYVDAATANGKVMEVEGKQSEGGNVFNINLTQLDAFFGTSYASMTAEQINAIKYDLLALQKTSEALRFDGVDDFVAFADTASLDITTAPFSMFITFKKSNNIFAYIQQWSSATNIHQPSLRIETASNVMRWRVTNTDLSFPLPLVLNEYINIGIHIKTNTLADLYVNGLPVLENATVNDISAWNVDTRVLGSGGATYPILSSPMNGDVATHTVYTGSDINKILAAEAKISAEYLALNP